MNLRNQVDGHSKVSKKTQLYLWLLTHTQAAVKAAERVPQAYRILG